MPKSSGMLDNRQADPEEVCSREGANDEHQQIWLQWLQRLEAETRSLCATLEHEQAALRERRLGVVMDLIAEKNSAVARINELLERLPRQSGVKEEAIQTLLAELELDQHTEAQAAWAQIRHLTAQCRQLNEANGATIALLQEYNRQSLALIFGRRRQRLSYGADGQVQAEAGERLLGAG